MQSDFQQSGQTATRVRTFIEQARRAQIIKSTIDVLADLGYGRTTMAEIARRAGISKGVIHYHFGGKQELIEEVVANTFEQGAEWRARLLAEDLPASTRLHSYILGHMTFIKTNPRYLKALMEIFSNCRHEDGSPLYDGSEEENALQFLEALLRQGQESGEFRPFTTRIVGLSIQGAVDLVPVRAIKEPGLDLDAYGAELYEMFWRAIKADPGNLPVLRND